MAKKPKPRRIVIDDIEYRWELRGGDEYDNYDWLGVTVVAATSPTGVKSVLRISLSKSTLILPSYIRRLILEARALGWDPYAKMPDGFQFQPKPGPYPDEPDPKKVLSSSSSSSSSRAEEATPQQVQLEEDLLASIREADETDDAPRLVYADWLMQHGDDLRQLRGEYISLACAEARRQLSPAEQERMRTLLEENQWKWLGVIGDVTGRRRWKRGLVEDVLLDRRSRGVVEPAIGDPGWLSVRRLDTRGQFMVASDLARIVAHPVLRNLDALATTLPVLTLLVNDNAVPDVEELVLAWGAEFGGTGIDINKATFAILPRLLDSQETPRRLKRLWIADGLVRERFLEAIDDPELTVLLVTPFSNMGAWQEQLNRHPSTAVRELHLIRSLTLMFEPVQFEVILRYDERTGQYSRLHIRWTTGTDQWARLEIRAGIEQLASSLSVLSAEGPLDNPEHAQWLRELRDVALQMHPNVSLEGVFTP